MGNINSIFICFVKRSVHQLAHSFAAVSIFKIYIISLKSKFMKIFKFRLDFGCSPPKQCARPGLKSEETICINQSITDDKPLFMVHENFQLCI
ncbi:hypothetical protein Scep_011016 [Stephania cephalantha]|uniref:Uncharacterized protein n=1 Tax=Stephania cephalantha TaxID=152367 RepID=A0AAP0JX85_9MAGN